MSWKEAKRQLRKDSRYELVDSLDSEEKEKLYKVHVEELSKRKKEKFREMLNEISDLTLDSSWKEIRKSIKEDVRYVRFSSSDRVSKFKIIYNNSLYVLIKIFLS